MKSTADIYLCIILDSPAFDVHRSIRGSHVNCQQVACFGTRTSLASEELVTACMADGRGARFGSGLTVAQGGCTEPRSALNPFSAWVWPAQSLQSSPGICRYESFYKHALLEALKVLWTGAWIGQSSLAFCDPRHYMQQQEAEALHSSQHQHCLAGTAPPWRQNSGVSLGAPIMCGWNQRASTHMSYTPMGCPTRWNLETKSSS